MFGPLTRKMLSLATEVLVTIFAALVLCLFSVIVALCALYRKLIQVICVSCCSTRVDGILPPLKNIFWQDSLKKDSRVLNICIWAEVEERFERETLEQMMRSAIFHKNEKKLLTFPEFQQYVYNFGGYNFWKWDPEFKLEHHYRFLNHDLGARAWGEKELKETICSLYSKPFDKGRSPWEVVIISKYRDDPEEGLDKSVIVLRIHHVLGDGYSFLKMFKDHVCKGDHKLVVGSPEKLRFKPNFLQRIGFPLRMCWDLGQFLRSLPQDRNGFKVPFHKLQREYCMGLSSEIDVLKIKRIKNLFGVKFPSVVISVVGAGLEALLEGPPKELTAFIPLPLPNRPDGQGFKYHATGFFIRIPVNVHDPKERLQQASLSLKNALESISVSHLQIAGMTGRIPYLSYLSDLTTNSFETIQSLSIFPGIDGDLFIGGNRMLSAGFAINPSSRGNSGIAISSLTCFGKVRIALTIDKALVPNQDLLQTFSASVDQEIEKLLSVYGCSN